MIILDQLSKKLGTRTLFEEVSVAFNSNNRYGLTGPNGSGKSTLLKIVVGTEEASAGTVTLPKKVGFLKQQAEEFLDKRVLDVVIMGNVKLWKALFERDELYEKEMSDAVGMRLAELEEIIGEEEGYTAESDAEILLSGMGFDQELQDKKMREIPTDLQFRVLLCQALFGNPEALLLDEPTNHLDLESIGWLENFLIEYSGTLIVVSHDRHFLNAVTTHIADIDYETVIIYPGNYDSMLVAKTSVRERAEQEAKSREKKITQLKSFVSRFGAGTRASQVQSRIREINRLQPQDLKKSNIVRPYIRFAKIEKPSGKTVFKAKKLSFSYGDLQVIDKFSTEIERGDKVAIIGNNGCGKTTLLKLFASLLTPSSGLIDQGHQVEVGYFPQNHAESIDKSLPLNAFDWLKNAGGTVYDQAARGAMGKLLFSGDDAFKSIKNLSGGETARLILASLMIGKVNTLLLDEPSNHLDLESVSALGWGLSEFKGTALIVSHNRDLIAEVATKIIAFREGRIFVFNGTLEEYLSQHST